MAPSSDAFVRYLAAKQTVDDRALHRPTFERLVAALEHRAAARGDDPVRILEVGFGIGTMLSRLREWDALPSNVEYVGVDLEEPNIAAAADRLVERGFERTADRRFRRRDDAADREIDVDLHAADAFEWAGERWPLASRSRDDDPRRNEAAGSTGDNEGPVFDLLIGMAFLDVVDFDRVAETLLPLLAGGGIGYFPITFDGETVFQPTFDADRDSAMVAAFHAAMDAPDRPGGSRTGRRLLSALPAAGAERLAVGGSDWVVASDVDSAGYHAAEADFLRHIVDTVERAVKTETPAEKRASLSDREIESWATQRREQVDDATLVYLAHNLDHLVRVP